jgi:acyl carrier protein
VHAAGCLDDGVIRQLTRERLERVMVPKVQGAWNLHQLSRDAALDFFVLFSSASSIFGSPGQANYAAGNAFLDALSPYRRAGQLPAISINWGAWSEVGMASRLDRRDRDRLATSGFTPIDPVRGIDALREVMRRDRAQMAVLPIDWTTFARQFTGSAVPAFVADLAAMPSRPAAEAASVAPSDDGRRLVASEPENRAALAGTYVAARIASVLGLNGVDLDHGEAITTLGLDSLMAVELKNRFEADLGVVIPVVRLLQGPSVRELADMLVAGIADRADGSVPMAVAVEEGEF